MMKTKRTLIALILCAVLLVSFGCAAPRAAESESVSYSDEAKGSYEMAAPMEEAAMAPAAASDIRRRRANPRATSMCEKSSTTRI
ncbi:MAG: hypothetical protein C0413_00055 [Clostridiales bacterium]|nr:hypothetical protein [Clostridiales bacterium]